MSFADGPVSCKSCVSINQDKCIAESGIRRSGMKNIDMPGVFVFSDLIVCFESGLAEMVVPQDELRNLQKPGPLRRV